MYVCFVTLLYITNQTLAAPFGVRTIGMDSRNHTWIQESIHLLATLPLRRRITPVRPMPCAIELGCQIWLLTKDLLLIRKHPNYPPSPFGQHCMCPVDVDLDNF
jgi:hypothetical protein